MNKKTKLKINIVFSLIAMFCYSFSFFIWWFKFSNKVPPTPWSMMWLSLNLVSFIFCLRVFLRCSNELDDLNNKKEQEVLK